MEPETTPEEGEYSQQLSIRMGRELYERIANRAKIERRTMAQMVRVLIEDGLGQDCPEVPPHVE